jgi:hypothetical protein
MRPISSYRFLTLLFFFILAIHTAPASADEVYTFVIKKQEEKAKVRWTLSEWLDTRDRMRMMDLWLAIHSPSPYEFFLSGNLQLNQGMPQNGAAVDFGAFVSIFGIETTYETNFDTRWYGIFDLRVFGYHDQSTNITFQGGLRNSSGIGKAGSYNLNNIFAGVKLNVYIKRYFGIEFLARHFFATGINASGLGLGEDRFQAGIFLDYKFLRIFLDYYTESNGPTRINSILIGPKLYF